MMKTLMDTAPEATDEDYSPSAANAPEDGDEDSVLTFSVPDGIQGQRLDQVLAALLPDYSRNRLQAWIREGQVVLAGAVVTEPKRKVFAGQLILVTLVETPESQAFEPENIPLEIVYQDAEVLVINKPAGLVVHPGSGNWTGTLLNGLLFYDPALVNVPRAGIVHRLDKDTSGLMVVARTLAAQTHLVRQLQARTVKRHYLALLDGLLMRDGLVDAPIGRHPTQRIKMAVVPNGKPALTHYTVLEKLARWTWVRCALETGRTHQIRVHMAHLGYPLVGDPVYGRPSRAGQSSLPFARQALHATHLSLVHPATGETMAWSASLPEDMHQLLERARASQ